MPRAGEAAVPASVSAHVNGGFASPWHRLADRVSSDETIVCRCEEITRGEVLDVLAMSGGHPDEVKRLSRAGMGLCQGRGCRPLIAGLIGSRLARAFADVPLASFRPPVRP